MSLFCCYVCERVVKKRATLEGTLLHIAVSTAVRCVSVGSSILIAYGYFVKIGIFCTSVTVVTELVKLLRLILFIFHALIILFTCKCI
jgi:hypothetical protein